MKSIREKANEYVSGLHPSIQRMCKESFETGANYVLDEIKKAYNKEGLVGVLDLIKQLKGNQ